LKARARQTIPKKIIPQGRNEDKAFAKKRKALDMYPGLWWPGLLAEIGIAVT